MGTELFTELSLVVALGAAIAALMRFLKQPLIIGHIITGIIAGPAVFNIIHDESAFSVFSSIGVALLLFIIGLELSIKVFSRLGSVVFMTAITQIGIVTVTGMLTANALGFKPLESFIIGLALALSSTIIIIKLFTDKKESTRLYAQIAIGVLLLQDLVATGGKIFLAAKAEGSGSIFGISLLIGRGVLFAALLYILSRYVLPKLTKSLESSKELLLLFALGWGLGIATLFEKVGFSIEIGALLAGVSLASLPFSHEMASRLKPLRDFFIVIFFITLGHSMVPDQLGSILLPAIVFTILVVLVKPLSVLISMGSMGYTKRASFKTAVAMSQISEFSLVFLFAANHIGLASDKARAAVTLVALMTFAGSTYLMKYDDQLYALLENKLRFFERKVTKLEQKDARLGYPIVLFGYRKGGAEFIRTFQTMKKRFVVVDYDPDAIEQLERQHVHYLYGDAVDPELIEELQLDKTKMVVSTVSDFKTNEFIAHWLQTKNANAVFICSADTAYHAARLYAEGAAYVMLPHLLGSEKIGNFLKRSGIKKSDFNKFREKHLQHLETYYSEEEPVSSAA
jgi:Kef-type K+ transport system membrane component KefB/voltage-gated potassium channel Kch